MKLKPLALLAAILALNPPALHAADDPLAWPAITAQCRPWAYWWWMGSAVDKTNITRELTRYHDAGLGGVHIIPIYGAKGFESNYISYLSPKWMEMMSWSVTEAKRLGMGVDMTTGTGWCFGGPQVTDEEANASVVVKTYELATGEKLKQKFDRKTTQALVAFGPDGKSIELTTKISAAGEVDFTAPAGAWTVYAISQKPSPQKVKRPAPGGEGWMLNLLSPAAMTNYLKWFSGAFDGYSGALPRAQYHDSYEYKSDWSPEFFAQFEKRRGYRLQTELPALFTAPKRSEGGFGTNSTDDHALRVLCDYRQTVSDIMVEETLPQWVKWSHDHGFITRNEAHGSPGNLLDLYAAADIPETEFFSKKHNPLVSKFASSAAHVTGKNLVSSESCTWLAEHFTETLAEVKGVMDELFLSGVNHAFYHGCCYSPDEAGWPGWHFYAATEMNPRNSIWRDAPAINDYIARVQSVLQSGRPDNDILLYWPISDYWSSTNASARAPQFQVEAAAQRVWFENQPIGRTAKELWEHGYQFDYVSDAQLKTAKVADRDIQMPGGKYKSILVPECKYIPLETFKNLIALAENGATVSFEKQMPTDVSGESNLEGQRAGFKETSKKIKFGHLTSNLGTWPFASVGRGSISVEDLISRLSSERIKQTCFIRRSFDGGWNYFIANRTEKNFDGWFAIWFALGDSHPQSVAILDPMTGATGVAAIRQNGANRMEVHLQLAAGESVILRAFAEKNVEGPAWNYWQTNGQPVEITSPWNVKFIAGGPTLPADFQTAKLASWTTFPDTNCQAFAGTAKYETTFNAPRRDELHESQNQESKSGTRGVRPSDSFYLNLGDVRQSARVRVNGKDYGTLITPPFRVVVDNLKPAGNTLEVEVTSTDANRIRDLDRRGVKWKTFRDINFVDINYKPFDASRWPLTDCGLLGPVTLAPVSVAR
ncbi:MAG: glycosyl hydrolase [Verrucomicrobia bacterium]|nr:glycosyl hydrolase [Verrucomicrobiota bacterium]